MEQERRSDPPVRSVRAMPISAPASPCPARSGGRTPPSSRGVPTPGQLRLEPERRHGGVRHGDGAHHARLDLGQEDEPGRPGGVGAGRPLPPRSAHQAVPGGHVEQRMPARVEPGLVDPAAAAVIGLEDGRVLVGGEAQLDRVRSPHTLPRARQPSMAQAPARATPPRPAPGRSRRCRPPPGPAARCRKAAAFRHGLSMAARGG